MCWVPEPLRYLMRLGTAVSVASNADIQRSSRLQNYKVLSDHTPCNLGQTGGRLDLDGVKHEGRCKIAAVCSVGSSSY